MDWSFLVPQLHWQQSVRELTQLIIAFILALPIGWERERRSKSAGIKTFPLVSVSCCAFMILGLSSFNQQDPQARVMYGLITGMGFIGGGAILKLKSSISGTTTAASMWTTAAIGMAVAWGRYDIALFLSLINVLTLRAMRRFKKRFFNGNGTEVIED